MIARHSNGFARRLHTRTNALARVRECKPHNDHIANRYTTIKLRATIVVA